MTHGDVAKATQDLAEDICENEKVVKFLSGTAPTLAGGIVGAVTGSPTLGKAANAAVGGFSRSHGKEVAQVVTNAGLIIGFSVISVVGWPILIGGAILNSIGKKILETNHLLL